MTLVFDENLSPHLAGRLADSFDAATHVESLGLKGQDDSEIWQRTKSMKSAIIVSKDDDFRERALTDGPPPKVLMLLIGNCSTKTIEDLLRANVQILRDFANSPEAALLELQ